MGWSSLQHTGPLQRECTNVKRHLLASYEKQKHKYKEDDVFHTNFKRSFDLVDGRRQIKKDDDAFKCIVDGEVRQVIHPYLESPCVFVGHHPQRGTCKIGVDKKNVIINVSKKHIPTLRAKGFERFVSKTDVHWFASWKDEITHEHKYLFFPNADVEKHIQTKFDHARALKRKLPMIRKSNLCMMKSTNIKKDKTRLVHKPGQQFALLMHLEIKEVYQKGFE